MHQWLAFNVLLVVTITIFVYILLLYIRRRQRERMLREAIALGQTRSSSRRARSGRRRSSRSSRTLSQVFVSRGGTLEPIECRNAVVALTAGSGASLCASCQHRLMMHVSQAHLGGARNELAIPEIRINVDASAPSSSAQAAASQRAQPQEPRMHFITSDEALQRAIALSLADAAAHSLKMQQQDAVEPPASQDQAGQQPPQQQQSSRGGGGGAQEPPSPTNSSQVTEDSTRSAAGVALLLRRKDGDSSPLGDEEGSQRGGAPGMEGKGAVVVDLVTLAAKSSWKESKEEGGKALECLVCWDAPPEVCCIPCAHRCLCRECARQIMAHAVSGIPRCPLCQSYLEACQ
eukprot:jgi/Mesvir1/25767/Mv01944-RA.2